MANLPSDKGRLEFMIKLYPDGHFSGLLGSGEICEGDRARHHGPVRDVHPARPVAPPAACSSAAAPAWRRSCALLRSLQERGIERDAVYYYGARTETDLFHLEELEELASALPSFRFVPALSRRPSGTARRGLITDVVERLEEDLKRRRRLRVRSAADGRRRPSGC